MRNYLGSILVMGLLYFTASTPAIGEEPEAKSLRLSLTAEPSTYQLGETIELKVILENIDHKELRIIKPVLDVHSISFNITCGAQKFRHTVFTPSVYDSHQDRLKKVVLDADEGILRRFRLPAFKPGVHEITVHYAGAKEAIVSPPVKVTVAAPEEESELCAVLETISGTIVFRFYPDDAPNTVINFINLAQAGFYTNRLFHRVIPDFIIQAGSLKDETNPTPGYTIPAEFNPRKHLKNRVSMARRLDNKDSAGCQFFICLVDLPKLDDKFSVFGKVIEGDEVVAKIGAVKTTGPKGNPPHKPLEDVVIKQVTIEVRPKE